MYKKSIFKNLECFKGNDHYSKILEIGPGTNSHIDYIEHTYDNYFIMYILLNLKILNINKF